ncbi:SDR family NAD(P)-dependent oxidoreductase [Geoalkalibacter sp.]|jgi:3-oxoacyl-[acyl-carrier protein] reductase|uniref:SDR family NAD(P)-dependent oxidoreductase n=1 Tax=Geoalkalibacter sp. TaxID=3041440 RepID=UPI00272E2FBF|nr:SDR family NAD(P)-dependent oxidoreductase [Geoalkalibacter sp.]
MFDFKGKTLVLTGANGGITKSIAKTFYELGANMVLTDLDEKGLKAFAKELDPSGKIVIPVKVDVSKSEECDAAAKIAKDNFGGVDFLVTGAGLYRDQLIATMTDAQWRETIGVNLDGVFYFCRNMIPLLRDGGAVVNIASMAAHRGSYQHAHYSAAKGATLSFSRSLALELAPRIRVNSISPGLIDTPLIQPLLKVKGPQLIDSTALKRLGRPEEVAQLVAYLCSDWASFITGESIHINGGLYIAG